MIKGLGDMISKPLQRYFAMLENFIFSVNAVVPIFIVMAIGYVIRMRGWTDTAANRRMNVIVFNLGLPVLLFRDVSRSNFDEFFDVSFVLYALATTSLMFVLSLILANVYFKNRKVAGTFSQACFRSNYAIMGLPLAMHVLGDANTGVALLPIAFVVPIYNIFTSIALAGKEDEQLRGLMGLIIIVRNIFNPLMCGILIGLGVSLADITLPEMVNVPVNYIAVMTTPLALLTVGGNIDFSKMRSRYKPALAVAFVKLVIGPLIFVPVAVWLGFGPEAVLVLYLMHGTPTAIVTYALVCNMGGDEDLALNTILFTMTFAVFTLTIGLFLMRTFGIL